MPTLAVPGLDLHYTDTGHGPAVVFLNGLAGDHLYWAGQVRACAGHCRCLAPDNRDVGISGYAVGSYTLADMAEDVAALLQRLHITAAHVVGLSLGSMIAQELALRHPERVRGLLLVSTAARADAWFRGTLDLLALIRKQSADTSAFFEALLPWLVSHRYFEDIDRLERLKVLIRKNPHPQRADGFFRQLDAIRGLDTLERLPSLRCPVLVVAGEDDLLIPPRYGRQIVERIPNARLVLLSDVGHSPPLENGRAFNRILREFLDESGNSG